MKLDELMKKYGFLLDEEGNYYRINASGKREEPIAPMLVLTTILSLGQSALTKRIKLYGISPVPMKNRNGVVCPGFNLNQIKIACADTLAVLHTTDSNGIALVNGRQFTSIHRLEKILGISSDSISKRLTDSKIPPVIAKSNSGRFDKVFDITLATEACADLLADMPSTNNEGIAFINNQQYASLGRLQKIIGIAAGTLRPRIRQKHLIHVLAKNQVGRVDKLYQVDQVRRACTDILTTLPMVNTDGIYTNRDRQFVSVTRLTKILQIAPQTIKARIARDKIEPMTAKNQNGRIIKIYSLEDVKTACDDLLANLPEVGTNDLYIINGQQFDTIKHLGKSLNIATHSITERINLAKLTPCDARCRSGIPVKVYNIQEVRTACHDILTTQLVVDANGIALINGRQFTSIRRLIKIFGSSGRKVARTIKNARVTSVSAKNQNGCVIKIYDIETVRQHFSDVIDTKPNPAKT